MNPVETRILLADDHDVVRTGVMKVLSNLIPQAIFGEAGNSAEILKHVNESRWDLVVMDISMPGRNGLEVLKEIREDHPELPVIIFSMYPEDQFAVRSIKAGASAYLSKDVSLKELARAITTILKGEHYFTSSLAELITSGLRDGNDKDNHESLSDREYQVFLLIASGKNVSSIATELSLSVKTISVYRANILKKMNLRNNSEITNYAFKNNLVS